MTTQLRIYTINRGRLDDFVQAWSAGVYPLRRKLGFRVDGAWVLRERNEFIWILSTDGSDFEAKDKAYYASPERIALDPDPAPLIARAEHWFVTPAQPE